LFAAVVISAPTSFGILRFRSVTVLALRKGRYKIPPFGVTHRQAVT
jgi:hypothetical protein